MRLLVILLAFLLVGFRAPNGPEFNNKYAGTHEQVEFISLFEPYILDSCDKSIKATYHNAIKFNTCVESAIVDIMTAIKKMCRDKAVPELSCKKHVFYKAHLGNQHYISEEVIKDLWNKKQRQ